MHAIAEDSALAAFHPVVRRWFLDRFDQPTGVQREVWPRVAAGENVLATAPTGSGKTLAAFLWAIDQLLTGRWSGGQARVLYISPLRALNNDVRRNLLDPLRELQAAFGREGEPFAPINVAVRSGDTEAAERRRMFRKPPEILITTPESLNLLISSQSGRRILTGVKCAILDEIHAVAGVKRGVFLMTAIERLTLLAGEFQRIALSATVEPMETIARFVAGYEQHPSLEVEPQITGGAVRLRSGQAGPPGRGNAPANGFDLRPRPISIVRSTDRKQIDLTVNALPKIDPARQTFWPVVARALSDEIEPGQSTLVFVNNRRLSERLCHLLNEESGRTIAYSHHGAMAREVRALVEQRLKKGELSALVATSSLELGIDIGSVEKVLLVQTPRSLNGAIQRVGRAGHRVGAVSVARFFPTHSADLLDAAVFAPFVRDQKPQALRPINNPLDVLAQICVAMCGVEPWKPDELYSFLRTIHSYHTLTRKAFDLVIQMLQGRYFDARVGSLRPRLALDEQGRLAARDGAMSLVYTSGGVIPDRGYFNVRIAGTRAVLGQLDEEFVWERRIGDQFRIGMQSWRIERITHNDVEVGQGSSHNAGMPFWRGESDDRNFSVCEKIGTFLERADSMLENSQDKALADQLCRENALSEPAAMDLIDYLRRQRGALGVSVPHRHHLIVEHFREEGSGRQQIIIHAGWGGSVLRPWAIAMAAAWQKKFGTSIDIFSNDHCLLLELPGDIRADELIELVAPEEVEPLIRTRLESTGFFGARFRENAGRALLLPRQVRRRMPLWLNRMRAKKLFQQVSRFTDFPIIAETWRECLEDHFECDRLSSLLEELRDGTIRVSEARSATPSPFCADLVWLSTNEHVYDNDQPADAVSSSLSEQTLREVLHDAALRPRLPEAVIAELRARLNRTMPGYAPTSAEELIDAVNERLAIPVSQWNEICQAIGRDQPDSAGEILAGASDGVVSLQLPGAKERVAVAVERVPRLLRACEVSPIEVDILTVPDRFGRPSTSPSPGTPGEGGGEGLVSDRPKGPSPQPSPRVLGEGAEKLPPNEVCERGVALAAPRLIELERACETWRAPNGDNDPRSLLVEILADILSFEGPATLPNLQSRLGVPTERLESILEELVESGRVVADQLRADATEIEFCDAENLERLLRLLRASHRKPFTAHPIAELPLLLATLQGIVPRGQTIEALQERLSNLFGYPAAAELWEKEILPARLSPYRIGDLDSLLASSDLMWIGAGKGELLFCFRSDLDLFIAPQAERSAILPESRGRFEFDVLREQTRLSSAELSRKLWEESWKGLITNDSFAAVRRGVENGFEPVDPPVGAAGRRRMSFRDWHGARIAPGNWHSVLRETAEPDRLEKLEADKERVRQALARYGVLFRELLARETSLLQWSRLLPALRLMELSGEVVAGQFFADLSGIQFASPDAFRVLQRGLDSDAIFWMNAADPASPCGLGLPALTDLPARQQGTVLIYHGARLVMVSRRHGNHIEIRVPADSPNLKRYLDILPEQMTREFLPERRIEIERINEESAPKSPYAEALKSIGFVADYKSLTLYRQF